MMVEHLIKTAIGCVDGLQYAYQEGVLSFEVCRPQQHNALSKSILTAWDRAFDQIDSWGLKSLEFSFQPSPKGVACAGLDLKDFAEHCLALQEGQDVLPDDYLFVKVMRKLRKLSKRMETVCRVNGHVIGAGMEMAFSCSRCEWVDEKAMMMLPYLKIGLPYHLQGLEVIVQAVGFDLLSRMILCENQVFYVKDVFKIVAKLDLSMRSQQARLAYKRFERLWCDAQVSVDDQLYTVKDGTGGLSDLLLYHMLLALKVAETAEHPALDFLMQKHRLAACTKGFHVQIQKHAAHPAQANQGFRKRLKS